MAEDNQEVPVPTGMEHINKRFKPQNRDTRAEQKIPTQEQIRDGIRAIKIHGDVGVELDMLQRGSKSKADVMTSLADAQLKLVRRYDKLRGQLERLKGIAYLDPLTGLLNRRSYNEYMQANSGKQIGMLFIDVDDFKLVNNYGYDVGDEGLKLVANAMLDSRGGNPILFRIGGDEFLAVYEDTQELSELDKHGDQTRSSVQSTALETPTGEIVPFSVSVSGGIFNGGSFEDVEAYRNKVSAATLANKKRGIKNTTYIFDIHDKVIDEGNAPSSELPK